ncbi:hypothetical protein TSOC_008480 [Tetrabaena socialis]|uniref:HNH domain-containing protein n=1 Tax=Tetrabaena socialis TaxID=47790 RepID=A0A2J7ZYD4_9CHLO|nr:hypothetical protein TSOC_008480 [Tetrabaena socialis]|eukprot:PNH05270.1 hypothetical protein TSOC_008480 [Tetrabaena socialis]
MAPKQCAFNTCENACTKSNYRQNFLAVYPSGYPTHGSGMYTCRECKTRLSVDMMEVDHIKPKTAGSGGSNCVKNLQPLCGRLSREKCNQKKGNTYSVTDKISSRVNPEVRRYTGKVADWFSRFSK